MNEAVLYTLAGLGMSFAGFSGLVVVLPIRRGAQTWSTAEIRMLGLLIGDSFLVLFLALLPVPLALANWSLDAIWALGSALLGSWFLLGGLLALRGEFRDRKAQLIDHQSSDHPCPLWHLRSGSRNGHIPVAQRVGSSVCSWAGSVCAGPDGIAGICGCGVSVLHWPGIAARPGRMMPHNNSLDM